MWRWLTLDRIFELVDRIIEAPIRYNRPFLTLNPEFGPPPYQPVNPADDTPLANIWDICLWMTDRFRTRWSQKLEYQR